MNKVFKKLTMTHLIYSCDEVFVKIQDKITVKDQPVLYPADTLHRCQSQGPGPRSFYFIVVSGPMLSYTGDNKTEQRKLNDLISFC